MSDSYSQPGLTERWVNDNGTPSNHLYEFLGNVADNNALLNAGIAKVERFSNLAAVQLAIPNPKDGYTVMFTGQGLGTYNEAAGQWRRSWNDTTVVT